MRIRHIFIAAGILVIILISAIIITNWNKHILYLTNGDMIEAGKTWQSFNLVFYEQGKGTLYFVKIKEVDEILSASFSSWYEWQVILSREMELKKGIFSILLDKMVWTTVFIAFCAYLASVFIRRNAAHKNRKKETQEDFEKQVKIYTDPMAPDMEKIVLHFLNLYLLQLNANKNDKYRFIREDTVGPGKTVVYDLQRRFGDRWQSRRMSLGRIGEVSGAKSKCFYVIYDDHMVVKVPQNPITDFNQYIKSIKAEKKIADILAPRECLAPKVSLVLKRIPAFVSAIGEEAKQDEQKCIEGLIRFPKFQKFLKIGNSFAFFMDLSKYYFLGHILEEIHDADKEFEKEIKNHPDMIWSPNAFEDRYGKNTAQLCVSLQNAFNLFDKQMIDPKLASYQKKEWFADALLWDESADNQKEMPVVAAVMLKKIKIEYKDTFEKYKQCITDFTQELSFNQNKSQIEKICANLLDLLAWLGAKHVAMRDLKPENLLVVGKSSTYPHFLKSAKTFQIGLIDVETAAYANPETRMADQPPLGWTPWYATPSHMFTNEILEQLYENMPYILHLQDWQATIVMIFEAITNEKPLFHATKTLAGISKEFPRYFGDTRGMIAFAKKAGTGYWKEAIIEFKSRMKEKEHLMASVHIDICRNAKEMFEAAAARSLDKKTRKLLLDITSGITAYDLLNRMFRHVWKMMYQKDR